MTKGGAYGFEHVCFGDWIDWWLGFFGFCEFGHFGSGRRNEN